ncbi:hypothetical protein MLD52_05535 [Puniceicoccaceae bacterium K14]|nr:hypothetical protein [Puniceicoccaceae bacterium K14]
MFGIRKIVFGSILACSIFLTVEANESPDGTIGLTEEAPAEPIILHKPRSRTVKVPKGMAVESQLVGEDIYERDGVYFHKEWSFKVGVTQVHVPAPKGLVSGLQFKGGYESFSDFTKDGDRLVGALISHDSLNSKKSESYGDFIVVISVPELYEYRKYDSVSFEKLKESLKTDVAQERKELAEREHFETFEDYQKYKYESDENLDTFVDGYRVLAAEAEDYIMYFFKTNLRVKSKDVDIMKDQSVTTTIANIRGKIVKVDVRITTADDETDTLLLNYSQQFIDWMKRANSTR